MARSRCGGADPGDRPASRHRGRPGRYAHAIADVGGLREVLSAQASFDVTPKSGGAFTCRGQVRARVGQTCVVTLDPIESDIDEAIDLIFAPPEQIPQMADAGRRGRARDGETPDPPEPIENGIIDLGRRRHRRAVSRASIPIRANRTRCSNRLVEARRSRGSPVCGAQGVEGQTEKAQREEAQGQVARSSLSAIAGPHSVEVVAGDAPQEISVSN